MSEQDLIPLSTPSAPSVGVVLLNYGRADLTLACLRSLSHLQYGAFSVWVVDNASPDDSVAVLEAAQGQDGLIPFRLIQSVDNGGYSAGNNLAIEAILAENLEYVWLLNNDTTVDPLALQALVTVAQNTGGLVGSLLQYPDGSYQRVGTRLKWWTGGVRGISEAHLRDKMPLENLTGASMLIPTAVVRNIGMLDASYFLYFEDGEYTLRALRQGYSACVSLTSIVFHEEGASTGRDSLRTQYYYHRNRLRMFLTYASPLQRLTIAGYTLFRLGRSIMKTIGSVDPALQASLRVQWLAVSDYFKGVTGPCPHPL